MRRKFNILDVCLISILSTILFVQEQALSFLPNIQLTILLLILYSKKLGFVKTFIIIIIHVILDNIFMGSFGPIMIPMLIGWTFVPIIICTIFRKTNNVFLLSLASILCCITYSFSFAGYTTIIMKYNLRLYLIADLPFTLLLNGSSILSVLILYIPLSKVMDYITNKTIIKEN